MEVEGGNITNDSASESTVRKRNCGKLCFCFVIFLQICIVRLGMVVFC